jgi:hypothetical protein
MAAAPAPLRAAPLPWRREPRAPWEGSAGDTSGRNRCLCTVHRLMASTPVNPRSRRLLLSSVCFVRFRGGRRGRRSSGKGLHLLVPCPRIHSETEMWLRAGRHPGREGGRLGHSDGVDSWRRSEQRSLDACSPVASVQLLGHGRTQRRLQLLSKVQVSGKGDRPRQEWPRQASLRAALTPPSGSLRPRRVRGAAELRPGACCLGGRRRWVLRRVVCGVCPQAARPRSAGPPCTRTLRLRPRSPTNDWSCRRQSPRRLLLPVCQLCWFASRSCWSSGGPALPAPRLPARPLACPRTTYHHLLVLVRQCGRALVSGG